HRRGDPEGHRRRPGRPGPRAGAERLPGPAVQDGRLTTCALWAHRPARWLFPAPAVLLVAVIIVYPIVYTGWMSLQEWFASSLTGPRFIRLPHNTKITLVG